MKYNQLFPSSILVVSLALCSSCKKEFDSKNTYSGFKDSVKVESSKIGLESVRNDKKI